MRRDVAALETVEFDLLVVGGGINGTGVARDAARRGLKVALVDKEDFGYGTTGRSTRLIHGGLRYLEMYDFGLVRESLRERKRLLQNAPHLVRPLPFLFPLYRGGVSRTKVRLGLTLYDVLAADGALPGHRWLNRDETLAAEPGLLADDLLGAFEYHDAQVAAVERACVENALDASAHGAVVANHVEVHEFLLEDGRVAGARVTDRLTDRSLAVRARMTFNATGPWLSVLDVGRRANGNPRLRMTKGIHLVTPPFVRTSLILRSPEDGRTFFAIPWGDSTLIGTTDTDYRGDLDDVHATREDVQYLVDSARRFFPGAPVDEVAYTTAGVRSLLKIDGVSESEVSRKHFVIDHAKVDGIGGLITLVGGKITPFRAVCEEVVDKIMRRLKAKRVRSDTRRAPLPGGDFESLAALEAEAVAAAAPLGVPEASARHLAGTYGTRYRDVLDRVRRESALGQRLCSHGPTIAAEVALAVEEEMAVTVADVLLRRTTAAWARCEARDEALEAALDVMQARLSWDAAERARQASAYRDELAKRRRFAKAGAAPAGVAGASSALAS